jgi:riboflavin kinase/FMN adenylyltransferase
MKRLRLDPDVRLNLPGAAVMVGNFDGVHRGHQALVAAARQEARDASVVGLTFDPHPSRVLSPAQAPSALMTLDQKAEVLESLGVDVLAVLPFTAERAAQTPEDFARDVLRRALDARTVVVGSGFRFGRGRSGDVPRLAELGHELGFRVVTVPPVQQGGRPISSTRVREDLGRGAVESAAELLGRPYFVDGTVVKGAGRGRQLGLPTANLQVVNEMLPAHGVYAGWCHRLPKTVAPWRAVINLGRRPTFGGEAVTLEAHLLDTEVDLYGQLVRLAFAARLRDERRFEGADALREQVRLDVEAAGAVLDEPRGRTL